MFGRVISWRPSGAMLVAFVALFLAVAGSSYAVVSAQPVKVIASVPLTVSGTSVDSSAEHVLASGVCDTEAPNYLPVTVNVPNTPGLRIMSAYLSGIAGVESDSRLTITPPGASSPIINLFVQGQSASGGTQDQPDDSKNFGSGWTDGHSGSWRFWCGSTNSDTTPGFGRWMILGRTN